MWAKIKNLLFRNISTRQTVAKNTFWLSLGNIGGRLLRAIIIIYAARVLGAADYGVFSYALSLAAFFTIITDIGVNGILTRETARSLELKSQYFSTAFFIKAVLLAISILLILFVAPLFTKIEAALPLIPIIAFLTAVDAIRDFGFAFVRGLEKMQVEAGVFIFTNVAVVVLGIAALLIAPTSINLAIGYTAGSLLGTLAMIFTLRREYLNVFRYFKKELVYTILSAAWPFALVGLLASIMINTDTIMLGWFRTASEIGLYAAAQRPVQLLYIIPAIIATSFFPTFSRISSSGDKEKFRKVLETALLAVFLIALPITAGGIILGKDIIGFIYGEAYLGAANALKILLLTTLLVYPGTVISRALFAYDKQKTFIISAFIGAVGNIILNGLLIPAHGIIGAALATIIAQTLNNGYIWFKMKKFNYFGVLGSLRKIIAATLVMAVFVYLLAYLEVNLLINIAASALVYFGALLLLKESLVKEVKTTLFKR